MRAAHSFSESLPVEARHEEILDTVKELGHWDHTIIALTGDHGEHLGHQKWIWIDQLETIDGLLMFEMCFKWKCVGQKWSNMWEQSDSARLVSVYFRWSWPLWQVESMGKRKSCAPDSGWWTCAPKCRKPLARVPWQVEFWKGADWILRGNWGFSYWQSKCYKVPNIYSRKFM